MGTNKKVFESRLLIANMRGFCSSHGKSTYRGVGPYELSSSLLESFGFPKGDMSFKQHCKKNIEFIKKTRGSFPCAPPKPKKTEFVYNGGDSFFESREWKALRYKALVLHGAACQCCGATRHDGVKMHVDHIKPRSKFPRLQLDLSNLQVLCEPCNVGKSNVDQTDWRYETDVVIDKQAEQHIKSILLG